MPCPGDATMGRWSGSDKELRVNKKEFDLVTRLLCSLCRFLEKLGMAKTITEIENGELETWWQAHKKMDAEREAKETEWENNKRLRLKALAKLTDEDKKVLGLK